MKPLDYKRLIQEVNNFLPTHCPRTLVLYSISVGLSVQPAVSFSTPVSVAKCLSLQPGVSQ